MIKKHGIIVHPEELSPLLPKRLEAAGIDTLGIHPAGGRNAARSLDEAILMHEQPGYKDIINSIQASGISVEYQAHVMSWLLPRSDFDRHPEWFRLDEHGKRVPEFNLCVSNPEALEYVSNRTALLAETLYTGSDQWYFWPDDITGAVCHCDKCRLLSASDQQMIMVNAMLRGIRKLDRGHRLCYLAYHDCIAPPRTVKPDEGVFLEYAPFDRDIDKPLADSSSAKNSTETEALPGLLRLFGKAGSTALDYWMDNSMRSDWKKPPKQFKLNETVLREDVRFYASLGFEAVTCFGCFLGADYEALYGEPPVTLYGQTLRAASGNI